VASFKIVLFSPEIPGNTGSIGRSSIALGCELIIIKPIGFDINEKAVRRAGLDYWKYVNLSIYENWEEFISKENANNSNMYFLTKIANKNIYEEKFKKDCYLIFGSETKGLPKNILENEQNQLIKIPMLSENIRSLNLANAATVVSYEVYRQLNY
jgi:tRNA (cytidine/uridine-2'-O-)-methyltransferase